MKRSLNALGNFLTAIMIIHDIFEFLAIPALIVICGLICGSPIEFYIAAIVIYLLIFAVTELFAYIFSKLFGKRINSFMTKKLEKYVSAHEKEIDDLIEKCEPTLEKIADTLTSDKMNSRDKSEG